MSRIRRPVNEARVERAAVVRRLRELREAKRRAYERGLADGYDTATSDALLARFEERWNP